MKKTDKNLIKFRHNNLKEVATDLGLTQETISGRGGRGTIGYMFGREDGSEFAVIVGQDGYKVFGKPSTSQKRIHTHVDLTNPDKVVKFVMGRKDAEDAILAAF